MIGLFLIQKIVHLSDIAQQPFLWYRNHTIFGTIIKYTLFRAPCGSMANRRIIPNVAKRTLKTRTLTQKGAIENHTAVLIFRSGVCVEASQAPCSRMQRSIPSANFKILPAFPGKERFEMEVIMREFMTKVSDYLNERRDDPERQEDRLSLAVIAAVVLVVAALLLLIWWGYSIHGKKEAEAAKKAEMLQKNESLTALQEEEQGFESMQKEAQGLVVSTYEEKMKEYMSQNNAETLRQEYLSDTKALEEKIRNLEQTMETAEKELDKVAEKYSDSDTTQKETVNTLQSSVKKAAENIRQMENKLSELNSAVQSADLETLPRLQTQLSNVRTDADQARAEVSSVRQSVSSLKTEDEKLWKELSAVEKNLDKAIDQNMNAVDKQLGKLSKNYKQMEKDMKEARQQMEQDMKEARQQTEKDMKETKRQMEDEDKKLENRMDALSRDALFYRYDQRTNTLNLMPSSGR